MRVQGGTAVPDASDGPTARRLPALLTVMCVALALVIGANSSLSLALPRIASDTGATQTELSWIVNAYALAFAAVLLPAGIAADRYGRRPALVLGLVVFGVASLVSGFLSDPVPVILLRALAGLGAAAVMPATLSVLIDAFPPYRRAFAVSVWAGVSGAGALVGVMLAGVLVDRFWWGSVQVAYGVGALAVVGAVAALVPTSRNPRLPLDVIGGLLSAAGLASLVYGVIEGPERGWGDPLTVTGLAAGVLGLAAFVAYERRSQAPMLDVRLFASRGLSAGSMIVFIQFFAAFGFFYLAPQFLQFVQGHDALGAALRLAPLALGIAPTSRFAPRLIEWAGARWVGAAGMTIMAVAFTGFAALGRDGSSWSFAVLLVVFGFGFGLAVTPGTALIIDGLPADRRTLASAVNDVTREVGGALGGAVAASVLVAGYLDDITDATAGLPRPAAEAAEDGVAGALGVAGQLGPAGPALVDSARDAFAGGYSLALVVAAAVLLLGAVGCALLAPGRRPVPAPEPPTSTRGF